ncbi:MAG: hypothetical protein ACRCYD_01810 [Plesiomonas sp.]
MDLILVGKMAIQPAALKQAKIDVAKITGSNKTTLRGMLRDHGCDTSRMAAFYSSLRRGNDTKEAMRVMNRELTEDVIYKAMRNSGEWLNSDDVAALTGLSRRVTKHHLKKFHDMDWMLERKRVGRWYYYRIKK